MKNFEVLLSNPELAKYIRIEITGHDLLELSSTLITASREPAKIEIKEEYISIIDACNMLKRDRSTLFRWKQKNILKPNQLGLYKKSDIDKFLEKK